MASPAATEYVPDVVPEPASDSGPVRLSRRRLRWKKWFWLLAIVVAVRVGLAIVLVPLAQRSLSRVLGTRVDVTDVSFAPIDAVFTLRNVVVHTAGEDASVTDGTPAITAGRVRIDVQWLPLLHRSVVLRELVLEDATIDVDRLRDAGWTLERFQRLEPATELPPGWTFGLERIALRDTQVRPGDVGTGDTAPLDVTVRDARVSIGRRRATAFGRAPNLHVDAVVDGGRILIVGSSDPRDDGVMIDATIHVKDAPLVRFGSYRPAVVGSIAGEMSGRLHYQRDPGRRDRIVGRLRGRHIAVQAPALAQPALAIRRVEIGVDAIDLLQHRVAIGNVMLYGARLAIRPDVTAPVPLLDGLKLPAEPLDSRRTTRRASGTPSWIWTIGHLESPFARLVVAGQNPDEDWSLPASIAGEHIGPGAYWSPVRAWIGWDAGTAVFDGTARMTHGFSLEGRLTANDVDAVAVARATGPPLATLVQAGRGSIDLNVELGATEPKERRKDDAIGSPLGVQGKLAVADLWLAGPDPNAFAFGAASIELDLARIVPAKDAGTRPEIGFSNAMVTAPYVRLTRTPEGWSTGATPGAMTDEPVAEPTVMIAVDSVRTRNGRVSVTDQTAMPALGLDLAAVDGSGRGLRLPAASLGEFDVQGTDRRLGPLRLVGARSAGETRADLTATAVNLAAAAPYLQRAKLPYAFTAGTGTVQSHVYVVGDRWTADTTLTLVDPALGGDETALEQSLGMTSAAAFATLRERQGQVSLQLPLASSPLGGAFALNDTVAVAMREALARPRLAPAIQVVFATGRTELDPSATRQLASIAETLAQNPDVVVELRGTSSRKDRRWIAEQTVAAEQPEEPGGIRGWFRSVVLRDQPTRIRDALAARGAGRPGRLDPEDESALGELVAAVPPIADERLLYLASTRAGLVASMLADKYGVAVARLVVVDPAKEVTGDSVVDVRFLPRQEMAAVMRPE